MKGHMENGKFHPHTQYKGVRKAKEPFPVIVDGVKLNQKQLSQMQRDAGVRGKRYKLDGTVPTYTPKEKFTPNEIEALVEMFDKDPENRLNPDPNAQSALKKLRGATSSTIPENRKVAVEKIVSELSSSLEDAIHHNWGMLKVRLEVIEDTRRKMQLLEDEEGY